MIDPVYGNMYSYQKPAYKKTGDRKTDAFFEKITSAAEISTSKDVGRDIGFATIPYSDIMSYSMSAAYADSSTEEDPVIRVGVTNGNASEAYDVHVKRVNPANASQLEMFALCSYTDDQGLTERGTFGSYERMTVYARNAWDNGYGGIDFDDPEQVLQKADWTDLLKKIAKDYCANAVTFAQGLDAKSLTGFLEKWKKRTNDLA